MEFPKLKDALLAVTLAIPPIAGYSFEALVKTGVHHTRDEIAALAQGVELNSFIWGNGSLDPTNHWTSAMHDRK